MTLDIAKFITNSIKMQAKIQHLDINTKTVNSKHIPHEIKSTIIDEYGDKYLFDANYVTFLWGKITKDTIKSMFNVVDKALGKSANKLTDTDFKKINISISTNDVEQDDNQDNISADDESDLDNDYSNDDEDNIEDNETSDDTLNEDDNVENIKTSYFFLKITTK